MWPPDIPGHCWVPIETLYECPGAHYMVHSLLVHPLYGIFQFRGVIEILTGQILKQKPFFWAFQETYSLCRKEVPISNWPKIFPRGVRRNPSGFCFRPRLIFHHFCSLENKYFTTFCWSKMFSVWIEDETLGYNHSDCGVWYLRKDSYSASIFSCAVATGVQAVLFPSRYNSCDSPGDPAVSRILPAFGPKETFSRSWSHLVEWDHQE